MAKNKDGLDLTIEHIAEILKKDLVIGSDTETQKKFVFNPWRNEYAIYVKGEYLTGGQDIESLLNEYNEI